MDYENRTLLQIYDDILDGNLTNVSRLLETQQINPNIILPSKGMNILHLAVGVSPIPFAEEVTRIILYHGGDPNECTDEGQTPLHVAASWERRNIVKMLLDHGADPYIRDEDNKTPLDYAMDTNNSDVIECLLEYFQKDKIDYSDSPKRYSMKLDKVIIDNGLMKGEYSLWDSDDDDYEYISTDDDSIKKSNYVKDWCRSNSKSHYDFMNQTQELFRNKNGDIMFTKPLSCVNITNNNLKPNIDDTKESLNYETCVESLPSLSDNDTFTNNNVNDKTDSGDDSDDEKSLSGIETMKFTRNDENNLYSVLKKSNTDIDDNIKTRLNQSGFIIPDSPVALPHKNYLTKSSIRTPVKIDESEIVQIDHELKINNERSILPDKSHLDCLSVSCRASSIHSKKIDETVASIVEEYKYEDKDAGVVLIEKRILAASVPVSSDMSAVQSIISSVSSLPASVDYDIDGLRRELKLLGITPGPITPTTKRVYLKKLYKLKKNPDVIISSNNKKKCYTVELEKTLRDPNWHNDLSTYVLLEQKILKQFETPDTKIRWREGVIKSSFTYLLLDPRITDNLPAKIGMLSTAEMWRLFVDSIFYIGKGKRSRPYSHLYQAVSIHKTGQFKSEDKKVQNILDIWNDNLGVVCLHIFQNVIPAEAYTREASMIEVMGLRNLKNIKPGNYYGIAASWPIREKKLLGVYLLYRAMLILLSEGERQLRPVDIR